jgi:hypothetical protein
LADNLRQNGRVIELTEPQVWVLIGVFAAAIFGMLSWQTISFNRTVDMAMKRVDSKIDALEAKLGGKIDSLDRDVQALTRHVFGADPH